MPVDVAKSSSTTAITLSKNSASYGTAVTATVVVTGSSAAPTGHRRHQGEGRHRSRPDTLTVAGLKGTATIALPTDLAAGTHQLTAVYAGNADVTGSQSQRSLHG